MASSDIEFQAVPSIGDIPAEAWDACANPQRQWLRLDAMQRFSCTRQRALQPVYRTRFLSTRWKPPARPARAPAGQAQHLIAKRGGEIVGVVPCYAKSHSRGEYVFDRGWADAYERAGGSYYPKLQVSVPFTPATGPRLLVREDIADADEVRDLLAKGLMALCRTVAGLVGPRHLRAQGRMGAAGRERFPAADRQAVPLGEPGLRDLRRFPRRDELAPPQAGQARAARCARQRHHHRAPHRQGSHRSRVRRLLPVLHGDRLAQMGLALPHPRLLLARRRRPWPTTSCW